VDVSSKVISMLIQKKMADKIANFMMKSTMMALLYHFRITLSMQFAFL